MKFLSDPRCKDEILARLANVRPNTPRRWGKMNAPQMICHLSDCFLGVMGDRSRSFDFRPHPMFKEMSEKDWMRWGYLHTDHHLRQFGQ
jgi:hypothetical protein